MPYLPNPRYEKERFIKIYADETIINKDKLLKLPDDNIIKYYNDSIKWMKTIQSEAKLWKRLQRHFETNNNRLQFRRAGSLKINIVKQVFDGEKGVDVTLATDMIVLSDMYDVAIIVSGDQDYLSAVKRLKEKGKWVVNVSFLDASGSVLPGGATRLNEHTDWFYLIDFETVNRFLHIV